MGQYRKEADQGDVGAIQQEAVKSLQEPPGRTKKIDGRAYIHFKDYCAWHSRKGKGDAEVSQRFVTASWNAWVEAQGGEGVAGAKVGHLQCYVSEDDYFICRSPWAESQKRARLLDSFAERLLAIQTNE